MTEKQNTTEKRTRILLVENEAAHAELICRAFEAQKEPVRLTVVASLGEARDRLAESTPDLVIADFRLPDGKGIKLLPADKEKSSYPIIIMTSHGDEQVAVEAMKAGALDYVVKSEAALTDMPRTAERVLREWGHIIERRRAEEEIRSLSKFSSENPNPVLRLAQDGKILYANDAARFLLDYWNREIGQVAPINWQNSILEAISSNSIKNISTKNKERIFSFEIIAIPETGYVNVYGRDITRFKKAEKALQESETRFRAVVNTAVDGIISIDERGIIQMFNPAAERIFGFSWSEVVDQNISILMPEPDTSEHDSYIKNYLNTGQAKIIGIGREVVGQHKDGSVFPMDLAISEMTLGEGKMFVGIVRDITERKRAEKQRNKLLKDLERANTELKDFAYVVSHDLKEPLRGISSLAQWIVEDYSDILDDAGRKQLRLLKENTLRMHHLIEGILAYSSIGRDKPAPVQLDSGKIAKDVIDSLTKPDTIDIRIEDTLPEVVYHETHLAQIFQNLVGNAIHHLGKPSGEITVSCREDGQFWEFCVRDNGVGIEGRHFERIFRIFQTLGKKNYAESTGVGLSLVRKIAETHGGKVWVESTVGQGSSFHFTIPKTIEKSGEP